MYLYIYIGDVTRLEHLLQHGADLPAARENGNSLLHLAVARKNVPLVIWLVEELKMNPGVCVRVCVAEKNSVIYIHRYINTHTHTHTHT
jgi:hypothetical protein